ncbi:MAG: three-Cys-motif partner protein TcmP [Anaerolineae bacterium]|nr:three-Cys-motif partner protein TcmP [Anaerolineae bacterium]
MPSDTENFFESKDNHPWSRIKDRILGSYMTPYSTKIVTKGNPLLFIDAFAGPGKTADGEPGSPLIICQAAEKAAKGRYKAIFVNKDAKYHKELEDILNKANFSRSATPILGDGQILLKSVIPLLNNQSVFLYIDPFGLNCEFSSIEPFLKRDINYSTEILINIHVPILHRLAARDAYYDKDSNKEQIAKWHEKLTRTLGGDYWKEALLSEQNLDTKTREKMVIDGYKKRLSSTGYLKYTGSCPVQASRDSVTKYHMVFASPHPDAMVILNDAMCKAFNEYMNTEETKDTLFSDLPWTTWRDTKDLTELVVQYTIKYPRNSRKDLWVYIVLDHFMHFTHSEYIKAVDTAIKSGKIFCSTPVGSPIRKTKRLNHDCVLEPTQSS